MMADQLTLIEQQIADLLIQKQKILTEKRAEALKEVKNIIVRYGFSAGELGLQRKKMGATDKPKVAAKYVNPENANETWTGRGKKPNWVERVLAQGRHLEDLHIDKTSDVK